MRERVHRIYIMNLRPELHLPQQVLLYLRAVNGLVAVARAGLTHTPHCATDTWSDAQDDRGRETMMS